MTPRPAARQAYVYLWLIHVDVWQKLTKHCKAIILQLKVKKNNVFTFGEKIVKHVNKIKELFREEPNTLDLMK